MEFLLEKIEEYVLILDFNGRIIFANSKFLNKFGYEKYELYKLNINEIINNDYLETDKVSLHKNGIDKELEFTTQNGQKIKLESNIFIDDFKGERSLFILAKEIENLNFIPEHLELLLDNIYTGTFIKDASGKYLYYSKPLCKFLGKSQEEVIGRYDEEIFPESIAENFKATDKIVIKSKVGKLYNDKINLFGKEIIYETYKLPIYDENNNLKYIIGTCKDTSLQNIARNEIFQNYNKAISANTDKSQDGTYNLLNNISNSIIEHSNAKGLTIYIYDKEALELIPYIKLKNAAKVLSRVDKIRISKNEEKAILDGKSYRGFKNICKMVTKTDIEEIDLKIEEDNIEYLCTYPMIVNNELIGILSMTYSKEKAPKYNQDSLFEEIADKLAMLVKNYRLSQELKLENKKRKEYEKELRNYLDVSVDLKSITNIDGYIIKANSSWENILGWNEEELKAMHYSDFIHLDDISILEKLYN